MPETLFQALFCYIAPGLLGIVGAWHIAFPVAAWKLGRAAARSEGLATADAPTPGALTILRIKGVVMLVTAAGFGFFSHAFFSGWGR